jgi:hypothetical protein
MQVTAIYQGNEIAYGEGSSAAYAIEECIDSIDSMYIENALEDIELAFSDTGNSTLPKYAKLTDYYYKEREYF